MSDNSVIARRLHNGLIQYGCGGDDGFFFNVGDLLLGYYNEPEMVEYLFGLGQLKHMGIPGSERGGCHIQETNQKARERHLMGSTERDIFKTDEMAHYGYFYDIDNCWYYVNPGPFRLKLKLEAVGENLDKDGYEYEFLKNIEKEVILYMFGAYLKKEKEFQEFLHRENVTDTVVLCREIIEAEFPVQYFSQQYPSVYNYFSDWILVDMKDNMRGISEIFLQSKKSIYRETSVYLR